MRWQLKHFRWFTTILIIAFLHSLIVVQGAPPVNGTDFPQQVSGATASPAQGYNGLDILFIIDFSGSMSGQDGWPYDPNDPDAMRIQGPEFSSNQLLIAFKQAFGDATLDINVGAIAFGNDNTRILDWVAIEPDNNNQWDVLSDRLTTAFDARTLSDVSLGNTNLVGSFISSVHSARVMFEEINQLPDLRPAPGEQHLRVIIVLTDGGPCVVPAGGSSPCLQQPGFPHERSEMARLAETILQDFPPPDYRIYALNLAPPGVDFFWSPLAEAWANAVCANSPDCNLDLQLTKVEDTAALASHLNSILTNLLNLSSNPYQLGDPLCVPPYQQDFQLVVFKTNPIPVQIDFLTPQGSPYNAAIVNPDSNIQSQRVDEPAAGSWTVSADSAAVNNITNIELSVNFIPMQPQLLVGDGLVDPVIYEQTPVGLQVNIVGSNGLIMGRDPLTDANYPLNVMLNVYDATDPNPDSRVQIDQIQLAPKPESPVQEYVATWVPTFSGPVELRASAQYAINLDDVCKSAFEEFGTFILNDISLEELDVRETRYVLAPISDPSIRDTQTYSVGAQLLDAQMGNPIVVPDSVQIALNITDEAGNVIFENVMANVSEDPAHLVATVAADHLGPGDYQIAAKIVRFDELSNGYVDLTPEQIYNLTVRPLLNLMLSMPLPLEESMPAQEFRIMPNIFPATPVTVEVVLQTVGPNSGPVHAGLVTGGQVTRPMVYMVIGEVRNDITDLLQDDGSGRYRVQLTDLGMGTYKFEASFNVEDEALFGDYAWAPGGRTASKSTERYLHPLIVALGGGTALLTIIAALVLLWWIGWRRRITVNAIKGTLLIEELDDAGLPLMSRPIYLTALNRNQVKLTPRKGLPREINSLILSTDSDEQRSDNSRVVIKKLVVRKEEDPEAVELEIYPGKPYIVRVDLPDNNRKLFRLVMQSGQFTATSGGWQQFNQN